MSDLRDIETWFTNRFENMFKKKCKEQGVPTIKVVKIESVSSGKASITLPNDVTNIIPNIKIGKGVTLVAGDTAYLLCLNGDIGNSYILTNLTMA